MSILTFMLSSRFGETKRSVRAAHLATRRRYLDLWGKQKAAAVFGEAVAADRACWVINRLSV